MDRASETGGQFRVIKVIMYNKVLASAVTMQENTHWDQVGAWSKALPGRLRNMSYISQNSCFGFSRNLQVLHGGLDPRSSGVSVRRPNHYTTGEGVFNIQNQGYFKIPRF